MALASAESAARDLYRQLLDAWNHRNAHDMAALFAADGTLIGFDGSVATGTEIDEHLAAIFADHPTAQYVAKVRSVRALGSTAAVLRAIVGMVPPGAGDLNPAANAHQSLVVEQHDGVWRIVHFQNTPAQYHGRPHLVEAHTAEILEVLRQAPT